jgi:hypothetical protein
MQGNHEKLRQRHQKDAKSPVSTAFLELFSSSNNREEFADNRETNGNNRDIFSLLRSSLLNSGHLHEPCEPIAA